jgi:hypothetical protein
VHRARSWVLALVPLLAATSVHAQSRTGWEMNSSGGIVRFPFVALQHGDPMEYTLANIPTPGDPAWRPAPNDADIGFDITSMLCGSPVGCQQGGVFTYFRTHLCQPDPAFRGRVEVRIGDVDDGARVTLFNATHAGGVLPGNALAMIFSLPHTTSDFGPLLDTGMNTIVITQVDDCCMRSALRGVQVLVNDVPLPPGLAREVCNGLDDDCNGVVDDGLGERTCGVGACIRSVPSCVDGTHPPCVPGMPTPEVCNGIDDDCNGMIDDGLGQTSCGVGLCLNVVPNCAHGMPVTCMPGRPRPEICNGIDDDCDGIVDNNCVELPPEPMPEPVPDVVDVQDATMGACHDWWCDPSQRIEGRAGPGGHCACRAAGARGGARSWVWIVAAIGALGVACRHATGITRRPHPRRWRATPAPSVASASRVRRRGDVERAG